MFEKPQGEQATRLDKLSHIVDVFRLISPRMTASYMSGFLAVARNPGCGPTEYAKMLGTIQPIASRILLELGSHSRNEGKEGLGLVDRVVSPTSLRNQQYFLTPKGRKLLHEIEKHLT